jgi:flagellin-like hook-associated protein FlgL
MNVEQMGSQSLLNLDQVNKSLLASMQRAGTGKRINQASDSPSEYFSMKQLEKEVRLSEVEGRNLEREQLANQSKSTRVDSAANLVQEISTLASSASDATASQEEKDSLQRQIEQLSSSLDILLQGQGAGTSADLGVSDLVVNGSEAERNDALLRSDGAFVSLLKSNEQIGSAQRQQERQMQDNSSSLVDLKSTLSTIQDADLAQESLKINQYRIAQNLSIQGLVNSQESQKSVLNLFA